MARGRRPAGARLVGVLEGSPGAKTKLRLILQTLGGERTVESACEELGICEAAFYKLRGRWLQEALESLEPRARGRPRSEEPADVPRTVELQSRVECLERELKASQVREEIAMVMPHLAARRREAGKKTTRQGDRPPRER